jgi:hypothetical protein
MVFIDNPCTPWTCNGVDRVCTFHRQLRRANDEFKDMDLEQRVPDPMPSRGSLMERAPLDEGLFDFDLEPRPIPMILICPTNGCGEQHIDRGAWASTPHVVHLCAGCEFEFQPADVPTVGVEELASERGGE